MVVIDPWEFVDSGDARGTLINRVLEGIAAELDSERLAKRVGGAAKLAGVASDLIDKLNALRKRVSWSKVAQVAITSAVTLTPNITGLVDALTPEPAKAPAAKGMRDFRADFGMGRRPGAGACDLDASCGTLGTRPEFTGVGFDDRNHRYLLRADADQSRLAPPSCCAVTRCRHDRGAQRRQVPRAVLRVTGLFQARCHDE